MPRTQPERCDDIVQSCDAILGAVNGHNDKVFLASPALQASCNYWLIVAGEAANALLSGSAVAVAGHGGTLASDLSNAKRLRDRLAHRYYTVDPAIVWSTIQSDLQRLAQDIAKLQARLP